MPSTWDSAGAAAIAGAFSEGIEPAVPAGKPEDFPGWLECVV
jgi:hypothetical protein